MDEQRPGERQYIYISTDSAIWFWRVFGAIIVVAGLALGIKVADDSRNDEFWVFLHTAVTPVGIGGLIIVVSELLKQVTKR